MGAGTTTIVPIVQGYTIIPAIEKQIIAGDDITDYVQRVGINRLTC